MNRHVKCSRTKDTLFRPRLAYDTMRYAQYTDDGPEIAEGRPQSNFTVLSTLRSWSQVC